MDDAALAAKDAAVAAEVAAGAAERAAEASEMQPDPNALIEADVAIAREEEETKRARIAANAQVEIAELNQQEPSWLSDIREFLARMEARMEIIESRLSSTPPASVIVENNQVPKPDPSSEVVEDRREAEIEPPAEAEVEPEQVEPEPQAPAKPRRRWI